MINLFLNKIKIGKMASTYDCDNLIKENDLLDQLLIKKINTVDLPGFEVIKLIKDIILYLEKFLDQPDTAKTGYFARSGEFDGSQTLTEYLWDNNKLYVYIYSPQEQDLDLVLHWLLILQKIIVDNRLDFVIWPLLDDLDNDDGFTGQVTLETILSKYKYYLDRFEKMETYPPVHTDPDSSTPIIKNKTIHRLPCEEWHKYEADIWSLSDIKTHLQARWPKYFNF